MLEKNPFSGEGTVWMFSGTTHYLDDHHFTTYFCKDKFQLDCTVFFVFLLTDPSLAFF